MCLSGRKPSDGSALQSLSGSSDTVGSFIPSPSALSPSLVSWITDLISSGNQQCPVLYSSPLPSRSRWKLSLRRGDGRSSRCCCLMGRVKKSSTKTSLKSTAPHTQIQSESKIDQKKVVQDTQCAIKFTESVLFPRN